MTRRSGTLAILAITILSVAACADDSSDGSEPNGTNSAVTTVNVHVSIQVCPPDNSNQCTLAGLPDADVQIFADDNEALWSGTTNKRGDVEARIDPFPESEWTVVVASPLVEGNTSSEPFTAGESSHVDLELTPSGRYNLVRQSR